MGLFELGDFVTNQGTALLHKIECDFLNPDDWDCLAFMINERLHRPFNTVLGVPRGGVPLMNAMEKYADPLARAVLIVDDVWVTGGSIANFIDAHSELDTMALHGQLDRAVVFARNPVPEEVVVVFQMTVTPPRHADGHG